MLFVRPVRAQDHSEILKLARLAGIGMTSLPQDSHVLEKKLAQAVASFAGKPEQEREEKFLFALEDSESGKIVGTTGIVAHVGLRRPFYSYKLSTIVQASAGLGVYSLQQVLHMVNDYTGASEIGSLFLLPEYRRDGIGKFLSRCRYHMLAQFPQIFSDIVISEIRGFQDKNGDSPFYKSLAQYFFQMDFKRADFINATQGGQFIADLMPKYPIYVALLPEEARAAIGVPLDASKPAKQLLEHEGFTWQGYIDVFDAGPTLQVERANIRTVRESKRAKIKLVEKIEPGPNHMISNSVLDGYRVVFSPIKILSEDSVMIPPAAARILGVASGDEINYSA